MAGLVLVFGFLRVFYFEKGADYYFNKALEINMEHTLAGKAKEEMDKILRKKSAFSLFKRKK